MTDERVLVRATMHQAGAPGEPSLAPGDEVYVDATRPAMRRRIKSKALVKVRQRRSNEAPPVTAEPLDNAETTAPVPDPTGTQKPLELEPQPPQEPAA